DDILSLDVQRNFPWVGNATAKVTWQRSQNGATSCTPWKSYVFAYNYHSPDFVDYVSPGYGFVGRFGAAPGASTMVIDANRIGHFFSPAQGAQKAEWLSLFPY